MDEWRFEWDAGKNGRNLEKHGVGFELAQLAFLGPHRVIARDLAHSDREERFYCFGRVEGGVLTVRFTRRGPAIRIIGAGYWREGKKVYEEQNSLHR